MSTVKGVVAAGHNATANAGSEILEAGGNAVDATIAAAFAACIAEPLLTGLGAGGYMLIHNSRNDSQELLDFAVSMPGKNLKNNFAPLTPTPVDFGETVQMFHGGHSSVGIPGFVAGLCEAHKKYASMPLKDLVAPAQKLAKKGVKINKQQEYLIEILFGVISITQDSKKLFVKNGGRLKENDNFYLPEIAGTLNEIAKTNGKSFYHGELAKQLIREIRSGGGLITSEDLAGYKIVSRKPATINYRGAKIYTNPPPSSGGALIAHSLQLLSRFDIKSMGWHSAEHLRHLVEVMMNTNQVRKSVLDQSINDEDVLERMLAVEVISQSSKKISSRLGNTTHISITDNNGNSVSMTTSNGSGSGVAVPGTGILLNNILGEEDLNPHGFHKHPIGMRMTSMMSPTIVLENGQPRLSIGSAGSNRIRSAILQTMSNVLDFGMDIKPAIEVARLHTEGEGSALQLEKGIPVEATKKLSEAGHQVSVWKDKNLFFGGVQAVERNPKTGELTGAGDPRRGGVAVVAG
jgi:gamma-glutamyltranspeptidase/glutathione hydrolase